MSKIQARLAGFEAQIQVFANEALISKEYLLRIITQVLDVAQEGTDWSNKRMDRVEQLFKQGIRLMSRLQPQVTRPGVTTSEICSVDLTDLLPPPHTTRMASVGGIDEDTSLGTVQIGGCDTPLSATLLFQMIRELQAQVAILTERSKNLGVIFDWMAFASEAKFAIWLARENPAGDGLAAFVGIVSIWSFGSADNTSPAEWLKELRQSKSIGLKGGGVEVSYLHSMKMCFPAEFIGSNNKTQITNLTTIKMLESSRSACTVKCPT